jgi:hypothetical protein
MVARKAVEQPIIEKVTETKINNESSSDSKPIVKKPFLARGSGSACGVKKGGAAATN